MRRRVTAGGRVAPALVGILVVVGVAGSGAGVGIAADTGADADRRSELEEAIGEAGVAERETIAELTGTRARRAEAEGELARLDAELGAAEAALTVAADDSDTAAGRYYDLYYQLEARRDEVRHAREVARSRIVDLYVQGEPIAGLDTVAVFIEDDFSTAAAESQYLEQVARVRQGSLHAVEQAADRLGDLADRAERRREVADAAVERARVEQERVAALREEQADRRGDLARAEADEQRVLERIQAQKGEYENELSRLVAESGSIAQMLSARQASQTRSTLVVTRPVPGPIVSGFGPRLHPILGVRRLHQGIDMAAAHGRPIVAAADGVVVWAGERGGYGNCTIIDHGNQYATLYAHQSRFGVSVGETVRAGETIGYVGNTGLSAGPHLHFEVRLLGIPVNPAAFLAP